MPTNPLQPLPLLWDRIVREPERRSITGIGPTKWCAMENQGQAPKRIPITDKAVGWLLSDLMNWVLEKAAAGDTPEARASRVSANLAAMRGRRRVRTDSPEVGADPMIDADAGTTDSASLEEGRTPDVQAT